MEDAFKIRLELLKGEVDELIVKNQESLNLVGSPELNMENSLIYLKQLKSVNVQFNTEILHYVKLVESPETERIVELTKLQMHAEKIIAELEVKLDLFNNKTNIRKESESNVSSKLPKIELKKFDGDILRWCEFWDIFSANVDSKPMNDVDKLLYLQSVLEGDARQVIEGLGATNKNYKIAVEALKRQYGKSGAVIDAHYTALYKLKQAEKDAKECRKNLNEIERHLRILESLGENINNNQLRVTILEKFPPDILYDLRMKMGSENEEVLIIRKHLDHIISAREASDRFRTKTIESENIKTTKTDIDTSTTESLHVKVDKANIKRPFRQNKGLTSLKRNAFYPSKNKSNFIYSNQNQSDNKPRKREIYPTHNDSPSAKKPKLECIFCENTHYNDECTEVTTLDERKKKLGNRCYICFKLGHTSRECKIKRKCQHCKQYGKHNRALCPKLLSTTQVNTSITGKNQIILQTAMVQIRKNKVDNHSIPCRALLDTGSQRTYVTTKIANQLNLEILDEECLSVFTFGESKPKETISSLVNIQIETKRGIKKNLVANVVPYIANVIGPSEIEISEISKLSNHIILADDSIKNNQVDLLIGNDYYFSFIGNEKRKIKENLYLIDSDFGWLWSGCCNYPKDPDVALSVVTYFQSSYHIQNYFTSPDLPLYNKEIKQMWELETIGIVDSPKVMREEEALRFVIENLKQINGRYYVKWPWNKFPPELPSNYGIALGRLKSLIRRTNTDILQKYDEILRDQFNKGIIEKVDEKQVQQSQLIHYLPHHCIMKNDKVTKMRIVYDASAKVKENNSLNECLYRGPLMLEDLVALILRFRQYRYGVIADIEKAFLQIGLQENDRDVTRFLWIKDINKSVFDENLMTYRFCRVPFGIVSSPFILAATIRHHLKTKNNKLASRLEKDMYVDNLVTGVDKPSDVKILYKVANEAFNDLRMNIREWNSNNQNFMNNIPYEKRALNRFNTNVLGLHWKIPEDTLSLKENLNHLIQIKISNKREILKVIASIFDPCGFVAPLLLPAKLFLQNTWKDKIKWDKKFSEEQIKQWEKSIECLKDLKTFTIPRYYAQFLPDTNSKRFYELHCFVDASPLAYAAVVYIKICDDTNSVVSFVMAKSRLAPLKYKDELKIPKLELLGALIGSRLITYVKQTLDLPITNQYLWSDSEIVLNWIKSNKLLPPFVTKRIAEIKNNKSLHYRYVPSYLNPADIATKPGQLHKFKLWVKGPQFLLCKKKWPKYDTQVESNSSKILVVGEDLQNRDDMEVRKIHKQNFEESSQLSNDINNIKQIQKLHFPDETNHKQTNLSKALGLFMDDHGIIRCKGRLERSKITYNQRFPILLPKQSELTTKIIEETHNSNHHVGINHTLAIIRKNYWIPQGRIQVRKVIKRCPQCIKFGGGPYKLPPMPPLPEERANFSLPFTYCGLDYLGPLIVLENNERKKKWVCLYTCLAVRAIHLEVVENLTAEQCVLALRRFIACRGLPVLLLSDNATQFKLTAEIINNKYCIDNNIKWKFIPELAPWWGGFYERMVGLVKHCLYRTIDKHLMNNSQLSTIIKEIEAVVNTRPLTSVGSELEYILKPSDFLQIGGPIITNFSEQEFLELKTTTKSELIEGWKRGQMILNEFRDMFVNQYLVSLRERKLQPHKQSRIISQRIPKLGDIVQIKGDKLNRTRWRVGKIIKLDKGKDGIIRTAKVKTKDGEYNRSIGHLYPLEIEEEEQEREHLPKNTTETKNQDENREIELNENREIELNENREIELKENREIDKRVSFRLAKEKIKKWSEDLLK